MYLRNHQISSIYSWNEGLNHWTTRTNQKTIHSIVQQRHHGNLRTWTRRRWWRYLYLWLNSLGNSWKNDQSRNRWRRSLISLRTVQVKRRCILRQWRMERSGDPSLKFEITWLLILLNLGGTIYNITITMQL